MRLSQKSSLPLNNQQIGAFETASYINQSKRIKKNDSRSKLGT